MLYTRATGISENEYFTIGASYQLGGTNFVTYRQEGRGIYIHFAIKEIGDGWVRTAALADTSFKIFFKSLNRKSQKQIDLADEWIKQHEDELFELYKKLDKRALLELVQSENISPTKAAA